MFDLFTESTSFDFVFYAFSERLHIHLLWCFGNQAQSFSTVSPRERQLRRLDHVLVFCKGSADNVTGSKLILTSPCFLCICVSVCFRLGEPVCVRVCVGVCVCVCVCVKTDPDTVMSDFLLTSNNYLFLAVFPRVSIFPQTKNSNTSAPVKAG